MEQLEKREGIGFDQAQGLIILANFGKPKLTVGAVVILQVFHSRTGRIHVDVPLVVDSLTRVFDLHSKLRYIVIIVI